MKRITWGIIREVVPLFLMGNFFFIFILLISQMMELADLLFAHSVPALIIIKIITYYLPSFLMLSIPISMLLAVLLAFNRFSSDSEFIAMRSLGAGRINFISPVVICGIFATAFSLWMSISLVPRGSTLALASINEIIENFSIGDLRERELFEAADSIVFYTEKRKDSENYENIIVISKADANIVSAKTGKVFSGTPRALAMQFTDGRVVQGEKGLFTSIDFKHMSINLSLEVALELMQTNPRFMSLAELKNRFAESDIYKYEYTKRFSLPFSAVIMGVLGLALGTLLGRSGRSVGIVLSCGAAFLFNMLYVVTENYAMVGRFDPVLLALFPVLILIIITLPVVKKTIQ